MIFNQIERVAQFNPDVFGRICRQDAEPWVRQLNDRWQFLEDGNDHDSTQ
jgi:hypothetical protein